MKIYPHQENGEIIELVRKDEHAAVVQELNERLTKQQADMLDTIVDLRRQIALTVSGYIGSTEVTSNLLKDVKTALAGGVAHARSRLELALTRYSKKFNKLTLCPKMPSIKTDVRLFDLVRYMRSELHQAELITDDEYAWLCSANPGEDTADGSPSRERLETYDELRLELNSWQAMAESLANEIDTITHVIGLTPLAGNKPAMQEAFDSARQALAAYESAKKGEPCKTCGGSKMTDGWHPTFNDPDNAGMHPETEPCPDCQPAKKGEFTDPLAEAVKRMEAVQLAPLPVDYVDVESVRAHLISAAKGEQP